MTEGERMSERIDAMVDRSEIIEVCTRMHWYLDRKEWTHFEETLAHEVAVPTLQEVRAVGPGEPAAGQRRPSRSVAEGTRALMDGLVTQHIVAGHHVDLSGDTAVCYVNGVSMHIGAPGIAENRVLHANSYRFDLLRTSDGWRIAALSATPIWAQGNESVCDNGQRQAALLRELDGDQRE